MSDERIINIINHFRARPTEQEHVEFKQNNTNPETLGQNISAIENIMIKNGIPRGYIIWGVTDETHEIVGTRFSPEKTKKGNEDLLLWLKKRVKPELNLEFYSVEIEDKKVVALTVELNRTGVSEFNSTAYIRIDKNTRKLKEFKETEKLVWKEVIASEYETMPAMSNVTREDIESLLDINAFYELRKARVPVERDVIFPELISCEIIQDNRDSTYTITNLGALLFAVDISKFPSLRLKAPRVIVYDGDSKTKTILEQIGKRGYAVGFDGLHNFIMEQIKEREVIDGALRRIVYRFPSLTVRELLANTIVHQDFNMNGTQPMVEIFSNRIVFTNAGKPIVPKDRFVDYPPTSRNQKMADELFRLGICEKRGTGWDKVAEESCVQKYPAPTVSATDRHTVVTLSSQKTLANMTQQERMWSIYINACWLWVNEKFTTNSTIRDLFDIDEENKSMASRLLSQAVSEGRVKIFDKDVGTRSRKYVPIYENSEENNV